LILIQFSFSIHFPLSVPLTLAIFYFFNNKKKSRKLIKTKKSIPFISLFLDISTSALRLLLWPYHHNIHLSSSHVSDELRGIVSEQNTVEASLEEKQLAEAWGLGAALNLAEPSKEPSILPASGFGFLGIFG
jgi:hypothetical protein